MKKFAEPLVKTAYKSIPSVLAEPNTGAIMNRGAKTIRSRIGSIVQTIPGGEDFVRQLPKTTLESYISGKDSDMNTYNGKFKSNKKAIGSWAWAVWPAPSNPPDKINKPKDFIELKDGGQIAKSKSYHGYF